MAYGVKVLARGVACYKAAKRVIQTKANEEKEKGGCWERTVKGSENEYKI